MHIVEFIGRLLLSALFLIEGFGKISIQEDVIMYMEDYGVPGILFVPATVLEILFPMLLIVGYKTKWAASVMALFTFTVAIIFHTNFSEGMQMILFLPATVLEILFPLFLIIGYKTKWAAAVMALFTFTVAIIFHSDFSEGMQMIFFLKDIAIAGGFMIIIVYGPGKISLDHYFKLKQE